MARYRDGGWWGVLAGAEPLSMAVGTFQQPVGPWWCIDWGYVFLWISVNVQVATLSSWAAEEEENKRVPWSSHVQVQGYGYQGESKPEQPPSVTTHNPSLCSVLSQPHAKAAMPCLRGHSPSHQIHCDMAHHQGSAHCDVVTMSLGLVIGFHTGTSPQLPLEKDCRAAFVHGCGDLPAPCKTRMVLSYLSCRVLTTLSEWHWRERTGTCCGLHVHLFGHWEVMQLRKSSHHPSPWAAPVSLLYPPWPLLFNPCLPVC